MSKPKIYPSVVSLNSDWKKSFREIKRLGLKEISLFVTTLRPKERKEFYNYLKKSGIKYVPHVHLRDDCTEEEAQWLVDIYGVQYFTIHLFVLKKFSNWKLAKKLCVEYNPTEYKGVELKNLEAIDKIAGFCMDISHYHIGERYHLATGLEIVKKFLVRYPVVINHLNGMRKKPSGRPVLDDMHFIRNMKKNFWHLDKTPKKLFSNNIFLEMSNSISKQLEIRDWLYENYF